MSTDTYELFKSTKSEPFQGASPFSNKQWNWVSDINNGVYSSSGLSLLQFDLSSIYNSSKLIALDQAFLTIPVTYVTAFCGTAANLLPPPTGGVFSTGLKSGYYNLIHAGDLTISGAQAEQYQPYLNNYVNFKLLSTMDSNDIATIGSSIGLGSYGCDNWQSQVYNAGANVAGTGTFPNATVTGGIGGNGISNNKPFPLATQLVTSQATNGSAVADSTTITLSASNALIVIGQVVEGAGIPANSYVANISGTTLTLSQKATIAASAVTLYFYNTSSLVSNSGDQGQIGSQFTGTYNKNYYSRLTKFVDFNSSNNFYGSTTSNLTNLSNINKEFKPFYSTTITANSNLAYWQDVAVIRLSDIFDSIKNLPMTKKIDATLRLYINVGSVVSNVTANGGLMLTSGSNNTFTNTCPLLQSCLSELPSGCTNIASALYISTPPTGATVSINTNNNAVSFNTGIPSHYMNQCRLYYPQIELKPEILSNYLTSNRSKQIVYTSILTNTFNNISANSSFSYLVQSGVSRIKSVIILPYLASAINGATASTAISGVTPFSQQLSPFDSAPATSAPISLLSLNVAVGGVNILSNNLLSYGFENFIEMINTYGNTSGSDLGLGVGLFNQQYWENNKVYFIDCSRSFQSDYITPRNINITATNNANVAIDLLVITEYEKVAVLDVETGLFNI